MRLEPLPRGRPLEHRIILDLTGLPLEGGRAVHAAENFFLRYSHLFVHYELWNWPTIGMIRKKKKKKKNKRRRRREKSLMYIYVITMESGILDRDKGWQSKM